MSTKSWEEPKQVFKVVCINVFDGQLKIIDKIVKLRMSSSRSALIRKILEQYLIDYIKRIQMLDLLTPEQIKIMGE